MANRSDGGGWGQVAAAGATALLGMATGNDYLVGAGGGAAATLHDSYKELNTSLREEERMERLQEAANKRAKHLAEYQHNLGKDDRERQYAQTDEQISIQRMQAEDTREYHDKSLSLRGEEQRLANDPEHQKKMGKVQADVAVYQAQAIERVNAASSKAQIKEIRDELTKTGINPDIIRLITLKLNTGIDVFEMLKSGQKQPTSESVEKVYQASLENTRESDKEYERLKKVNGSLEAEKYAAGKASADVQNFQRIYAGASGSMADSLGGLYSDEKQIEIDAEALRKEVENGQVDIQALKRRVIEAGDKRDLKVLEMAGHPVTRQDRVAIETHMELPNTYQEAVQQMKTLDQRGQETLLEKLKTSKPDIYKQLIKSSGSSVPTVKRDTHQEIDSRYGYFRPFGS